MDVVEYMANIMFGESMNRTAPISAEIPGLSNRKKKQIAIENTKREEQRRILEK